MQPLTDEEFETLKLERDLSGETVGEQSKRIFQSYGAQAATAICKLAMHSQSERIRYQAATYVVERVLGRIQDDPPAPIADPYEELIRQVTKYVQDEAAIEVGNDIGISRSDEQ